MESASIGMVEREIHFGIPVDLNIALCRMGPEPAESVVHAATVEGLNSSCAPDSNNVTLIITAVFPKNNPINQLLKETPIFETTVYDTDELHRLDRNSKLEPDQTIQHRPFGPLPLHSRARSRLSMRLIRVVQPPNGRPGLLFIPET